MFLTYPEYLALQGSTDVTDAEFTRLEYQARSFVNAITYDRIKDETPVRECVKYCMAELVNVLHEKALAAQANPLGAFAKSASNDGISVSYSTEQEAEAGFTHRMNRIAFTYLHDEEKDEIRLLYAGME